MESEDKILEVEGWKGRTETLGFREIVMKQVARITVIGSKELTKGWWKKSVIAGGSGEIDTAYISDGREAYSRATEILHDLLQPKFDKDMKDKSEELNKEVQDLFEEYNPTKDVNKYRNGKLKVMRKMFQELCKFLERLGWLEETTIDE